MQDSVNHILHYLMYYGRSIELNHLIKTVKVKMPDYIPKLDTFYAFKNQHLNVIQVILKEKYFYQEVYNTILVYASMFGDLETIQSLLEFKEFLQGKSDFYTDLLVTIFHKKDGIFELLSQNEIVSASLSLSEWDKLKHMISNNDKTRQKGILKFVQENPEKWIPIFASFRDMDFTMFCIENIEFKDKASKMHVMNKVSRHASFFGDVNLIDYLLKKYGDYFHFSMVESAIFGDQDEILDHLLEYMPVSKYKELDMHLLLSIYNYNFDLIEVYMKYHPDQVSPLWILKSLLHSASVKLPTRYLVKLLDDKSVNKNVLHLSQVTKNPNLIQTIAAKDVLSFQFLAMNYFTRDWILGSTLQDIIKSNPKLSVLKFIFSEPLLFNKLSLETWHELEYASHQSKDNSLLKSAFKAFGKVMRRRHVESKSLQRIV